MWWKNGSNPGGSRMVVKCKICGSPRNQKIFWKAKPVCSVCYDRERTKIKFMPRKPSVWWREFVKRNGIK